MINPYGLFRCQKIHDQCYQSGFREKPRCSFSKISEKPRSWKHVYIFMCVFVCVFLMLVFLCVCEIYKWGSKVSYMYVIIYKICVLIYIYICVCVYVCV